MFNIAYVFPGQGSQSIGMLSELADHHSQITDVFNQVSDKLGYDLWSLVQQGPDSQLNQTEYTQAAMLTADVAVFQVLKQSGFPKAHLMAGHSLGEYAALTAANAISLTDAALLVSRRGQIMQQSIPMGEGAMAAIVGLSDDQVSALCRQASDEQQKVTPANYNAIGQVVIAGHTEAVHRAVLLAEEMDARLAKVIPVSVPCHCPLLSDAAEQFAECLAETDFRVPDTAVISNVDLSVYQSPEQMRRLLKEQLYSPVRWVETIQLMKNRQTHLVIECGPGKVLSGLVKRIDKTLAASSIYDQISLEQTLGSLAANEHCQ
ncbi:ACP S-malonyltransferase [Legionella erythra]|uniref:Malonyl CoA-acyl carrier protein transacylase n=1 Tax=Legionella erythra TaxID=448 RepID=A0A0W0TRC5_LEGER|nr:ACP S-malonyltransferase [Legionella erythra]KTC98135.1 malonyl CoA-ACP transacylase [Legionella erythra]